MTEDDRKLYTDLVLHPAELAGNRCNGGFGAKLGQFIIFGHPRS